MFWRLVTRALLRRRGRRGTIVLTVALGASLSTALLSVVLDVGDKVNAELKTYGANITVQPRTAAVVDELYGVDASEGGALLDEAELGNLKTIFWAHNIVDFAPLLDAPARAGAAGDVSVVGTWFEHTLDLPTGETFTTGVRHLRSWWDVQGRWPDDAADPGAPAEAMAGTALAERAGWQVGDAVELTGDGGSASVVLVGLVDSGGAEDDELVVPLAVAQRLTGRPGTVGRVEVSALTTPDNELSERAAKDPSSLSITDWETWYCTAYVSSIAYQIEEVVTDSVAKPLRQVADSEGAILEKTRLLMLLVTALSLVGAALGVSNLVTSSVMERAPEIGLLEAVGARSGAVTRLLLTETTLTAVVGGLVGYGAGLGLAQVIGHSVFGSAIAVKPVVLPMVAALVLLVVLLGSLPAVRLLLSLRPAQVLHGR